MLEYTTMIEIYCDGAYNPVLGQGGWAAVVVEEGEKRVFSGVVKRTTSNRMEISAALEGILQTPQGAEVAVYTDSQYLFGCMNKGWQRRANRDLWQQLDAAVSQRKVRWQWIEQSNISSSHKEAHALATNLATQGEKVQAAPSEKPKERRQARREFPVSPVSMATSESRQVLRIIDANLNRIGEGLRLLEDLARLVLNDAVLTQQLKTMRHEIVRGDWSFNQQLLQWRNSEGDVGIDIEVPGEEKQRELPVMAVANARRVQESLRTLEELAKVPGTTPKLDPEKFKQARFNLYTIEKDLLSKLLRQDKTRHLSGLYVIIDTQALKGRSHIEAASQAIRGGAKTIQLRDKTQSKKGLLPIAQQLKNLCAEHNVLFIVNDYLDLALAVDADGLHLGQDDLPIKVARKLLPMDKILGGSARTIAQATAAQSEGADYIAVGSMYPTTSKETAEVVGPERLRQIRQAVSLPLVAIGGINRDNVTEVMRASADAVAVIRAVLEAEDIEEAARQIVDRLEGGR